MEKFRSFVEIIPYKGRNVKWVPAKYALVVRSCVNDTGEFETLDDAIFGAKAIGSCLLENIKPENLFFFFCQPPKVSLYIQGNLKMIRENGHLFPAPRDKVNQNKTAPANCSNSDPWAIIICKIKESESGQDVLIDKQNCASSDPYYGKISWSQLNQCSKDFYNGFLYHICVQQCNRRKTFHHIRAYRWKDFPLIVILNYKTWKNSRTIFHLLQILLPKSAYYDIKQETWKINRSSAQIPRLN